MRFYVLGINHTTATVDLREKIAFSETQCVDALAQLKDRQIVQSAVVLSTCNRTEIYYELAPEQDSHHLVEWLCDFHQLNNDDDLLPSLYVQEGEEAVLHLMRVASGLDSLVLGEPQILGQVKSAFSVSQELGAISRLSERLFHKVFMAAKRIRTETSIGAHAVSVAFAACTLARQIFESISDATILLIGAGETIELVLKHLVERDCNHLIIANRTVANAAIFAERYGAKIISLTQIPEHLHQADIVISSTAATMPIVTAQQVKTALHARHRRPMLFIDIAVPRDIEQEVGDIEDAYLYTVDDLQAIVERNLEQRKMAAIEANQILEQETMAFLTWLRSRDAVDSIKQYRAYSEVLKTELLNKSLQALASGDDPQKVLVELSNKLTNKLIHAPTHAMQEAAKNGDEQTLERLRQSLVLDLQK